MTVERRDQPVRKPSLEELLNKTRQDFINTETYDPTLPAHPDHGKIREGYTFGDAAWTTVDTLSEEGVDIFELLSKVARETKVSPTDTDWAGMNGLETWEEIIEDIVQKIIKSEMPNRFPELVEENKRRGLIEEGYEED